MIFTVLTLSLSVLRLFSFFKFFQTRASNPCRSAIRQLPRRVANLACNKLQLANSGEKKESYDVDA